MFPHLVLMVMPGGKYYLIPSYRHSQDTEGHERNHRRGCTQLSPRGLALQPTRTLSSYQLRKAVCSHVHR